MEDQIFKMCLRERRPKGFNRISNINLYISCEEKNIYLLYKKKCTFKQIGPIAPNMART